MKEDVYMDTKERQEGSQMPEKKKKGGVLNTPQSV